MIEEETSQLDQLDESEKFDGVAVRGKNGRKQPKIKIIDTFQHRSESGVVKDQ
jgi:hypothetical protein